MRGSEIDIIHRNASRSYHTWKPSQIISYSGTRPDRIVHGLQWREGEAEKVNEAVQHVCILKWSPNVTSRPGFSSKKKWVLLSALHGVMGIMATTDVIIFTSITHRHASPWYLHGYTISEDSLRRSILGSDHTETKAYTRSIPVWSLLKKNCTLPIQKDPSKVN